MMMNNLMKYILSLAVLFSVHVVAQSSLTQAGSEKTNEIVKTENKKTESTTEKPNDKASPKMVQSASFNLGTTITGNQEQPKVLYILPWQSPQTDNVDFEMLDNQQKAVFGHLEREELRRELEFSGDTQ